MPAKLVAGAVVHEVERAEWVVQAEDRLDLERAADEGADRVALVERTDRRVGPDPVVGGPLLGRANAKPARIVLRERLGGEPGELDVVALLGPVRVAADGERVLDSLATASTRRKPGRSQAPISRSAARARSTTAAPGPESRSSIGYGRGRQLAQRDRRHQVIVVGARGGYRQPPAVYARRVKIANDVFRFVLELCMLAALGYGGFEAASGALAWVLLVALPLAAAVVWGMFIAPKARRPTVDPIRIVLEVTLFGAAGAALVVPGRRPSGSCSGSPPPSTSR